MTIPEQVRVVHKSYGGSGWSIPNQTIVKTTRRDEGSYDPAIWVMFNGEERRVHDSNWEEVNV